MICSILKVSEYLRRVGDYLSDRYFVYVEDFLTNGLWYSTEFGLRTDSVECRIRLGVAVGAAPLYVMPTIF